MNIIITTLLILLSPQLFAVTCLNDYSSNGLGLEIEYPTSDIHYRIFAPLNLDGEEFVSMTLSVSPDKNGREGDIHIPMAVQVQEEKVTGHFYMLIPKDWAYVIVTAKYGNSPCRGLLQHNINQQ